jgi:alcohol dehydrogenase class IV
MTFNRAAIAEKTEVIARVLDLPGRGFDGLLGWVLKMRRELGIPHALADIGVSADKAGIIGREAAIDPSAGGNPIPVDAAMLERIFRAAVSGSLDSVVSAE